MPRTLVAAENLSPSNMLNQYRYRSGQFSVNLLQIGLSGSDVKSFLQTQSTFDIDLLNDQSFHLVSFLDPQGRLETYGWLTRHSNEYTYYVPVALKDKTIERLNRFLISEDVTIADPEERTITFLLGPDARTDAIQGILFDEKSYFLKTPLSGIAVIPSEEVELWRALTGWPSFDASDFSHELFNNLRLFDLSLVPNKGCYPGQETVSKIATRRGAAFSPVLLESDKKGSPGDVLIFEKKAGNASGCYEFQGKYYFTVSLLRDFRVENMKLQFTLNNESYEGIVKYYPFLKGDLHAKAEELFYDGSDAFRRDQLELAEEKFREAIHLDPHYGDAYESLGVMLGRQERFQEAVDLMKQLSEIDPKSVLAHTNMSLYLMRLGKITEAEEQKSLATVKSFQSFGDEAKRKEALEQRKKQQEAEWAQRESMFRQVLEIDPEDTLANYGIGSIAVERSDWETARTHLERVIEQDPKYSVAYLALGKALKGMGLKSEARKIWEEGIKVAAGKGDLMPANQMQQELSSF